MVVLVLDFDGTMTDAEAEGRPYRQGCLEDLAVLCGKHLYVQDERFLYLTQ